MTDFTEIPKLHRNLINFINKNNDRNPGQERAVLVQTNTSGPIRVASHLIIKV